MSLKKINRPTGWFVNRQLWVNASRISKGVSVSGCEKRMRARAKSIKEWSREKREEEKKVSGPTGSR